MREIKFRAWDGILMHTVSELSWTMGGLRFYGPGVGQGICHVNSDFTEWGEVDAALMMFTGLKDKLEREIFEGDILKNHHNTVYAVEWKKDAAAFNVDEWEARCCEIIGNVYENPDLLAVDKTTDPQISQPPQVNKGQA